MSDDIERAKIVSDLYEEHKSEVAALGLWRNRDPVPPSAFPTIKASLAKAHNAYEKVSIPNDCYSILREVMIGHHERRAAAIKKEIKIQLGGVLK